MCNIIMYTQCTSSGVRKYINVYNIVSSRENTQKEHFKVCF